MNNQEGVENLTAVPARVFLASSYWRSAMNISDMRTFDNEADAVKYGQGMAYGCRVYELFTNKEPRRVLPR